MPHGCPHAMPGIEAVTGFHMGVDSFLYVKCEYVATQDNFSIQERKFHIVELIG
jgi:hypothetical protein